MHSKDPQKNKSLNFSFLDGVFASLMNGFTQDYFGPFLLALGAGARHIGVLNSLSNLFSSLFQLKSPDFVQKVKSRKRIINIFVFLQAIMLLAMIGIAFSGNKSLLLFIVVGVMFTAFGAIATPAWASLMSDLVEQNSRGAYFGWRNRVLGFIAVGSALFAGVILHLSKKLNVFYGFTIVFSCAFVFRMVSLYFLTRMHEPRLEHKKEASFTLFEFVARIRKSNFAKFVLFVSLMNFCVNLASPFFGVLMLKDLHFDYLTYSLVTVAATLTTYCMIGRWGRLADKVGNLRVIMFSSPIIATVPLWWVINRHPLFLIFSQIVSGFAWSAFNLCTSNFIYDAVTPEKRTRCIAYFSAFNGLALCLGSLLGAFLLAWLPALFGYKILTLCIISSALRMLTAIFIPPKLKEVRGVEEINNRQLFLDITGINRISVANKK